MGVVFDLAEAMNLAWGEVSGQSGTSLRERLRDRSFRREVEDCLNSDESAGDVSAIRRVMKSNAFREWLQAGGATVLEQHLSNDQAALLGIDSKATAEALGEAIGRAMAAAAYNKADWIQRVLLSRADTAAEADLAQLNYLEDIWQLLSGLVDRTNASAGWVRLLDLDNEARAGVARSLAASEVGPDLRLPREDLRKSLSSSLAEAGDLIVKGDSGVGKSALVMDAIEPEHLGDDRQAIAINLRHLPSTQLSLLSELLNPIDELLAKLSAPERLLVIDGAEAAAESHGQVFSYLLRCAREAGLKVVAVAAAEGAGAATELMKAGATAPREYIVPGLADMEIDAVVAHLPALQRLAEDPRARELLRRPIVVDLLGRAGDPGLPLSESEALDHIWRHLVRNGDRRDAGAPDDREQVMLQLAAFSVHQGDVDELLARLDTAAVEGLRLSGLILPTSGLPWERVPEFKHDLLRSYSLARHLLSDRSPATALMDVGAPRWSLPAARLACEILLSAPDEDSHPLAGRFDRLQTSFERLVAAGHGERWGDVPSEALLAVPESQKFLQDAWTYLVSNGACGLARILRLLDGRHRQDGMLDRIIAEPVVKQLISEATPSSLKEEIDELVRDWLRTHALRSTPAGQATRVAIRTSIQEQCAKNEGVLDEQDAAEASALAARTAEEVAADEERRQLHARLTSFPGLGGRSRPEPERRRPYLWIDDSQMEHLALLGADLGAEGEAILRRIAEDEPHSLNHVVEPLFAGNSLANYDPSLLTDLADAYYIVDQDDGFGRRSGFRDDGIRRHRFIGMGTPLMAFYHGPFLAMLRADYRGGIRFINRMLNHASQHRVETLSSFDHMGSADAENSDTHHTLSIAGEPRTFVGDSQVWLWYRGTGVGPYPCMSALQALELVTEEYIQAGVPATRLTPLLLDGAASIAMPALALGILVRHLEAAQDALDPFLVEPAVWEMEFSRALGDRTRNYAAQIPGLSNPERRAWSMREVSMVMAMSAEGERVEQLKALGDELQSNARLLVADDSSPSVRRHLAAVQNWAASLDRSAYEVTNEDGQIVIQQMTDPEVEQVLGESNADLRRGSDAAGLTVRHAHTRSDGRRAPKMDESELTADLATARDLLDNPPQAGLGSSWDGPAAVAASALELHYTRGIEVGHEDLRWSAIVLLSVAAQVADRPSNALDDSFFGQGADRSAGRALPLLLLPIARELRLEVVGDATEDIQKFLRLCAALASSAPNEVKHAFAQVLDFVWAAPCEELLDSCHHEVAMELVESSFLTSVLGGWDSDGRRRVQRLDPPSALTLDDVEGDAILVTQLTPAIRATGSAAISSACCKQLAGQVLNTLLVTHQRAMLSHEHAYHHSQSDALVAARSALWQAIDGSDGPVLAYIDRYLGNPRLLAEALQAVAAAGDERAEAASHARRLWPRIIDRVLDAAGSDPQVFGERVWGGYAEGNLVPNPTADWHYSQTVELADPPHQWRDLLNWSPQVERWLDENTGNPANIDRLVIAVRELELADQLDVGLSWIERLVQSSNDCANTFTLPEWLREMYANLSAGEQTTRWQRVVDSLVVAGDRRVADLAD